MLGLPHHSTLHRIHLDRPGRKYFMSSIDASRRPGISIPAVLGALLLLAQAATAGDLAGVKARGKLIMLCYPSQNSTFVAADLEVMRGKNPKLAGLRNPEQLSGLEGQPMEGFGKGLGVGLGNPPRT